VSLCVSSRAKGRIPCNPRLFNMLGSELQKLCVSSRAKGRIPCNLRLFNMLARELQKEIYHGVLNVK